MKFTILHLLSDQPFFADARAMNESYAAKHGYAYELLDSIKPDKKDTLGYGFLYQRASETLKRVKKDTAVLYLDPEAYVVQPDMSLETIMELYFQSAETAALFPDTSLDSKRRIPGLGVSLGNFLVREHEQTKPILDAYAASYDLAKRNLPVDPTDAETFGVLNPQDAFNRFVFPRFRENINVANAPEFGGIDGTFIRHQTLMPAFARVERIKKDRVKLGV